MIFAVYRCLSKPHAHVLYIESDRAEPGLDPECPWDGFHMPRQSANLVLAVQATLAPQAPSILPAFRTPMKERPDPPASPRDPKGGH